MNKNNYPNIELRHIGGKFFEVVKDIEFTLSDGSMFLVKAGMQTDLSSSPRALWGISPPYGNFLPAAILHDCMYINDYRRKELGDKAARKFADKEMLYISNLYNKNRFDNKVRYFAVRLFGHKVYKKWQSS